MKMLIREENDENTEELAEVDTRTKILLLPLSLFQILKYSENLGQRPAVKCLLSRLNLSFACKNNNYSLLILMLMIFTIKISSKNLLVPFYILFSPFLLLLPSLFFLFPSIHYSIPYLLLFK